MSLQESLLLFGGSRIGKTLGSGHYGNVFKGEWRITSKDVRDVAIKCLKGNANKQDRVKFLQEAATMAQFKHPNVVALFGVTNKDEKTMIIVEFLLQGDLFAYLHTLRPDPGELVQASTPSLLLQFSQQISLGMNYLANTGFVHRDLAARNILISDTFICKIADFGMSRDLHEGDYYTASGGKIPLKWTAPEALHYKKYSTASDVWSYGCVLYEIWSLGHKPFEEMGNMQVLTVLDTGGRLAPPPGCPMRLYECMIQCWSPNPRQRPSFKDILVLLLENESIVLHIPSDVASTHPLAATMGAPLKAGFKMYMELQRAYMSQ